MSSPLPWGTPSTTSTSTTSASSLAAIFCAVLAPTLPAPTTVTFLRIALSVRFPKRSIATAGSRFGKQRARLLRLEIAGDTQAERQGCVSIQFDQGLENFGVDPFGWIAGVHFFSTQRGRDADDAS